MTKTIDQRMADVEDLIADIPAMLNLRLESLSASQQDTNARIGLLDRQLVMLARDVRDLRNGVIALQTAQDQQLAELKSGVADLKAMVETVISRLPGA